MLKNNSEAVISSRKKTMSDKVLMQAACAQCVFVLIQTLVFPGLGIFGAIVAAQCAAMPWLLRIVRSSPLEALALSATTALLSPVLSVVFSYFPTLFKIIAGGS